MTEQSDVAIPLEFGGSWPAFVRDWCLGSAVGYNIDEVSRALIALKRHWPQEVERLISDSLRGVGAVVPAVDLGLLLNRSELAQGFPGVLRRLVGGERSAYSELVMVAALQSLGYEPRFDAPIDGKVLDAACDIDGRTVYIEVVAPQRPVASADEQRRVVQLTTQIRGCMSKCRVEIELHEPLLEESVGTIVAAVKSAHPSEWRLVASVAKIRRIDVGQSLLPLFDGDGAQITVAEERTVQGDSASVIARWEESDVRAKRVFNGEYHHFSKSAANVLVVNTCGVSDGMELWPITISGLLRPTQNRKVGAVVFFHQGSLGPPEAIRRRWRIVVNPHAHLPVPDRLLTSIESLDESEAFGLQFMDRIVAS